MRGKAQTKSAALVALRATSAAQKSKVLPPQAKGGRAMAASESITTAIMSADGDMQS
jgi:hypothetical protein